MCNIPYQEYGICSSYNIRTPRVRFFLKTKLNMNDLNEVGVNAIFRTHKKLQNGRSWDEYDFGLLMCSKNRCKNACFFFTTYGNIQLSCTACSCQRKFGVEQYMSVRTTVLNTKVCKVGNARLCEPDFGIEHLSALISDVNDNNNNNRISVEHHLFMTIH